MTNDFFHGVQGFITNIDGKPVKAIRSSVIGMVVTAGKGPVNVPTLCFGNLTDFNAKFGPSLNDGFTAGMAAKAIFDQLGTLICVVNVCDPAVHKTAISGEVVSLNKTTGKGSTLKRYISAVVPTTALAAPITLDEDSEFAVPTGCTVTGVKDVKGGTAFTTGSGANQWSVTSGVLTLVGHPGETVWLTYTATLTVNTDYTVDSGLGQIRRVNTSSKLLRGADITVGYDYVDPTKVDVADIIGTTAVDDTPATGIYALRSAPTYPGVLTKPKILIAPGWSHLTSVAQELDIASRVLNGRAIVDAPNTNVEECTTFKEDFAGEDCRVSIYYPNPYIANPADPATLMQVPLSPFIAGLWSKTDKNDGQGIPYVSPSNKEIKSIQGLTRTVDHTVVNLGETAGESTQQFLNSQNIATIIRESGWRAWGNTQANGDFICVQRMADFVLESAVLALVWAIDKSINGPALLDQILTVIRQFLRSLEAKGALIANPEPETDNDVWFPPELNTPDQTAQGIAYLNFRMNPPPPLQRLVVTGQLTHEFVKQLFTPES